MQPDAPSETPHVSCSSINALRMCEFRWYDHYVLGHREPASTALHFGTALDETHNEAMRLVIAGQPLPSPDDCEDVFAEQWSHPREEVAWSDRSDPTVYGERGRALARLFREEVYPTLRPVAVQERYWVEFVEGFAFLGFSDLRVEGDVIIDFKTAGKSWIPSSGGDGKELMQLQPAAYTWAHEVTTDRPAGGFEFIVGVKTKAPYVQRVPRPVSDAERRGFLRVMLSAWRRMEDLRSGRADPIPVLSDVWYCSRKRCNAAARCEATFGVRIPE